MPLRYTIAQLLVNAGSPIAVKDNSGKTVIDVAALVGDANLQELFVSTLKKRAAQNDQKNK